MTITTAAGNPVDYSDLDGGVSTPPAVTGTTVATFTHFDLTVEVLGATNRYNCWGFTFLPRRYWINDVDIIIQDNCIPVSPGSVQPGDVIRYKKYGQTKHTGRVAATDGAGNATLIRSKWGGWGEYFHAPLTVPDIYGTDIAYFRQVHPLKGVADLWIKDSPADDGEQYSGAPWWTSPDILVDTQPYDGVPDLNPKFMVANRVWTTISNRSDLAANNVYVRYYWADPAVGLGPSDWHLITPTSAHPNPVGPFSVPAYAGMGPGYPPAVTAPFVMWTPSDSSAHQCLLAIAYINNDNPQDSTNRDPLVYSFDVPWENNIAQRNVHIINPHSGKEDLGKDAWHHKLSIGIKNPFPDKRVYSAEVHMALTHAGRLPLLNPGKATFQPQVTFSINNGTKKILKNTEQKLSLAREAAPIHRRYFLESPLVTGVIPKLAFGKGDAHKIDLDVAVPKDARPGSTYYLHIMQKAENTVIGGYTIVVMVPDRKKD